MDDRNHQTLGEGEFAVCCQIPDVGGNCVAVSSLVAAHIFVLCSKNPSIDILPENEWVYSGIVEEDGDVVDFVEYFDCEVSQMQIFSI